MTDRETAKLAMINVSTGSATEEQKLLVETMDERLFSDLYEDLRSKIDESNYAVEDYYPINAGNEMLEDDEDEDEEENEELIQFKAFLEEFGDDYDSTEEAYKDFIANYYDSDRNYSEDDYDYSDDMEPLIIDEFSEFLVLNERLYSDSEEAYDDYIRNYCSYL